MYQTKYANAYTEVYEILNCLNEEEYNKIPEKLIEVFEENRNLDYEYEVNEEQDLMKQPMLIETKAILLNIFRDYLATSEQSKKIKQWQDKDRQCVEKKKREEFNINIFNNESPKNKETIQLPVEIKKTSFFRKILNKLKMIFKI